MRLTPSLLCTCAWLALSAGSAAAQVGQSAAPSSAGSQAQSSAAGRVRGTGGDAASTVSEVVVTGTLIRGTPRGGALPVDVISSDELQKQGAPTALELIKNLPISNGVLGDTNQFDARAQGSEGSGSVNLRGLGPERTLVLLNGRRMAINPFGLNGAGAVDTNILPAAAIDRVEVLKDGAAATYGSDAIAGVVNFITRKDFKGFDVGGSYRYIRKSDGDWDAHINYGSVGNHYDFLLSVGYEHRSELRSPERDFSNRSYLENPEGGWTLAGNPPPFVNIANVRGGLQRDPGCALLGSFPILSGSTPLCAFRLGAFDNLVEKENRVQIYTQLNFDVTEQHHFHGEVLASMTEVPEAATSPSYPALIGPTREAYPPGSPLAPAVNATGNYFVPPTNPGLIDLARQYPQYASLTTAGALLAPSTFRPYGFSGNPLFGNGPSRFDRHYAFYRVSLGMNGDVGLWGLNYDINAGYSQELGRRAGWDTAVDRFQLALRGLGGPNCNAATGTPGQGGCMYFNPFSTAFAGNVISGTANPTFNSGLANSAELTNWFFLKTSTHQMSRLFTVEGTVSGETPLKLWGGNVAFALGAQFRHAELKTQFNDLGNTLVTPCLNTLDYGVTSCGNLSGRGPFMFLAPSTPANLSQDIHAFYGELQVPVTDTLKLQLAARYEDYGGQTGSTFDPKLSVRWQALPMFALRGSIGTTFRGPPLTQLNPSPVTGFLNLGGAFRAVDFSGDPGLQPESATTYSVGGVFQAGGFNATLDYWSIDIDKGIVAEPAGPLVAAFQNAPNGCTDPAIAELRSRFIFPNTCTSLPNGLPDLTTLSRVETFFINGPKVKTSGLDFLADWRTPWDLAGGHVNLGASVSYVLEYHVGKTVAAGVTVADAFDAVGRLNYQTVAYPTPRWKGQFYAEYANGPHNLRASVHYIDGYNDERAALLTRPGGQSGVARDASGNLITVTSGAVIGSFLTVDLDYRVFLPQDATLSVSFENIFDADPPFARLDLSYDPFTANALGRTIKVGLNKRF